MEKKLWEISWSSLWKIFAMAIFAVALFYMKDVLIILLIAIVISSAIHAPVSYLESKKIPRILSVFFIFIVSLGILGLILYTLVPVALIQLKYFVDHINDLKVPLLDFAGSGEFVENINSGINDYINGLFSKGSNPAGFLSSLLGDAFFAIVCLVLSFYMALSRDGVERFILAIFPPSLENYIVDVYHRTRKKLSRWLSGQLVVSFMVGFLVFIGLLIVGADYALILALLAAVLELIPYVGPIIVGIISFLITLPQSFALAILVLVVFTVIQQIENHVLTPFVMSKAVGLDPVVVVIAVLAGTQIAGLVGIILAIPITIILQEIIDDWTAKKKQIKTEAA